jgi:hypothetical protein
VLGVKDQDSATGYLPAACVTAAFDTAPLSSVRDAQAKKLSD